MASLKGSISYGDIPHNPLSRGCTYICTYICVCVYIYLSLHIGVIPRAIARTWCPHPTSAGRTRRRRLARCTLLSGVTTPGATPAPFYTHPTPIPAPRSHHSFMVAAGPKWCSKNWTISCHECSWALAWAWASPPHTTGRGVPRMLEMLQRGEPGGSIKCPAPG